MAFRESSPVEERIALFNAYESGAFTVVDLCERYDISRETFYVWKRRRDAGDARWFDEKSRTPGHCPHATPSETVAAILALRQRFPRFGPKKIRARLALDQPGLILPAASTIGDILKREGLIEKGRAAAGPSLRARSLPVRTCPTASGQSTSRAGSAPATGNVSIR